MDFLCVLSSYFSEYEAWFSNDINKKSVKNRVITINTLVARM